MRKILGGLVVVSIFIFFIFILEIFSRIISPLPSGSADPAFRDGLYHELYLKQELDRSLPRHLPKNGGDCLVYRTDRLYWNPYWGFHAKKVDAKCARTLFRAYPISVALLGGSALANMESPNYLTHIDWYAFGPNAEEVATLNFAESGARLSNMFARFVNEVIPLKPTVAIFVDGFNEFNSIRYGGEPGVDFYWTASVRSRIENPLRYSVDWIIQRSALAKILFFDTGLISSNLVRVNNGHSPPSTAEDVKNYLSYREVIQNLCNSYEIKCLFVIQPNTLVESATSKASKKINEAHLKNFPNDAAIYKEGYSGILDNSCTNCVDASGLLSLSEDAYFDVVHLTKIGSKLLGELLYRKTLELLN